MIFQNILILCLGNICRSPIAHVLFEEKGRGLIVDSAGLTAMVGDPAHPFSKAIMARHGYSLDKHIAKQVSAEMVTKADLILVMDDSQRRHLESHFNAASGKTFRLGHFQNVDIPDPYGESEIVFDQVYQLIDDNTQAWLAQF
jgi:protein-tyrosine phosphatase